MNILRNKLLCLCFFISIFTIFEISSQENSTKWYIARVKSGTTINQKEMYGPYDSLDKVLATWIYSEVKENSKYCITKNYTYITTKPSTYYRKQYNDIHKNFMLNMDIAAENYGVDTENLIGKKNKSKTKKTESQETEEITEDDENQNDDAVNETKTEDQEEIAENENNETEITENDVEEVESVETVEELEKKETPEIKESKEYKAATTTYQRPVKKEEPVEVVEKVEQENEEKETEIKPYTFEMDKTATVTRYRKEYLHDFIPEEKIIPTDDIAPVNKKIENPDKQDKNGRTALMISAKSGNDWQIKNLLESDADVNIQDKDGWTALMYAVRYQESTSIVKSLLAANADVKINNNFDSNALTFAACYNNNPEILRLILDNYNISEKDVLKAFSLLLSSKQASEYIELAKVNVFMERSIPLNSLYNGKTPLMYAAQYAHYTSVIKMLLDNNALTGLRSSEGKTAFDYAVNNKNLNHDEIYWSLNKK